MGRPSWATPDQIEFLESFVPNLDREKKANGLKPYYDRIALQFFKKWPAEPSNEDRKKTDDESERQRLATVR